MDLQALFLCDDYMEAQNWPLARIQADALEAALVQNTELLQSAATAWQRDHRLEAGSPSGCSGGNPR